MGLADSRRLLTYRPFARCGGEPTLGMPRPLGRYRPPPPPLSAERSTTGSHGASGVTLVMSLPQTVGHLARQP